MSSFKRSNSKGDVNKPPEEKRRKTRASNKPQDKELDKDMETASSSENTTLWVQLEGIESVEKFTIGQHDKQDLYVYAEKQLCIKLEPLTERNIRHSQLKFIQRQDRFKLIPTSTLINNLNTSWENPLIIRYPFSNSEVIVTLALNRSKKQETLRHDTGLWYYICQSAEEIIKNKVGTRNAEYYFIWKNGNEELEIKADRTINNIVTSITPNELNGRKIDLTIHLPGRKAYSDWELLEALKIFGYKSLSDLESLELDIKPPPDDEHFKADLRRKYFNTEFVGENEATCREFISSFLHAAVYHINVLQKRKDIKKKLFVKPEEELNGSKGHGNVDFLIKLLGLILLVTEAKKNDMEKGTAQNLMQMHSAFELWMTKIPGIDVGTITMYGIVTTGLIWRFIKWTGGLKEPKLQYFDCFCTFDNENMEGPLKILGYVISALMEQVSSLKV